jgi:hypothetical protein
MAAGPENPTQRVVRPHSIEEATIVSNEVVHSSIFFLHMKEKAQIDSYKV